MLKLRLWCEHSTADGSVAYVCMRVDAEVGGQLCIAHGVSGLRQARTLSADGRKRLADVWGQTGFVATGKYQSLCCAFD